MHSQAGAWERDNQPHQKNHSNSCVYLVPKLLLGNAYIPNHHIIAQCRMALALIPCCAAQSNAMIKCAIITNFSSLANQVLLHWATMCVWGQILWWLNPLMTIKRLLVCLHAYVK
jgi:hypothetical protein